MIIGFLSSIFGVIYFAIIFSDKWVYPYVTYVSFAYAAGICLLSGNAFGNAVLKLIEERSRQLLEEDPLSAYTEEDIEREVEKTLNESFSKTIFSSFSMGIKDEVSDFVPGKALREVAQAKIEVKDSIREVEYLQSTMSGKVKVNDYGIDLTSKMLSATMKQSEETKKQNFTDMIKNKVESIRR
jgi:hypothetical protein